MHISNADVCAKNFIVPENWCFARQNQNYLALVKQHRASLYHFQSFLHLHFFFIYPVIDLGEVLLHIFPLTILLSPLFCSTEAASLAFVMVSA